MKNINVVTKKLVKPSTPTPPHLKTHKFSFTDEFLPALLDVGVLLFYQSKPKRIRLEESLAKVLVQFYPLAGRYNVKDQTVDCTDQGAEFVEAEAPDVELARLTVERNLENLSGFLSRENHIDAATYPILSIQITQLKCGGLVIGISIAHKVFDASSVSTFIAAWSGGSNGNVGVTVKPSFDSSSFFPGKNQNNTFNIPIDFADTQRIVVKRFTFNKEAIGSLKSSLRPNEGISKGRAVSALIAKALIRLDRAKHGRSRDNIINQAVNMRERTIPPLHKHVCGNLVLLSVCRCITATEAEGVGIQDLVDLIGDATKKSISSCAEILSLSEDARNNVLVNPMRTTIARSLSGEANVISFTDYSKFGFYEADFGWGKPVWASTAPQLSANMTVLMENKEGNGIEAWVHLEKNEDMRLFEQDEGIRLFAN